MPVLDILDYDHSILSFFREKYRLFFVDLLERMKVDFIILDYNYIRLNQYLNRLAHQHMRVFNVSFDETLRLDEKEYPIALEFYLQFDGNERSLFFQNYLFIFLSSVLMTIFLFIIIISSYVLYENMYISLCTSTYITRGSLLFTNA